MGMLVGLLMMVWIVSGQYMIEPGWELKVRLPEIDGPQEFEAILTEHSDKHIFVDFFTPGCVYCYKVSEDLNKVFDEIKEEYGDDQIIMFKANGN